MGITSENPFIVLASAGDIAQIRSLPENGVDITKPSAFVHDRLICGDF